MAASLDMPPSDLLTAGPAVDSTSITPPQSASGKKEAPEGMPAELSDLELDAQSAPAPDEIRIKQEEVEDKIEDDKGAEDIEDIEPDHYYGDGGVPVFKPVSEHFNSSPYFLQI